MSRLENLVPPLEMCKQIPAGEFEDTALVWCRVRGKDVVCAREHWVGVFGMSPVPAPTLEEVLEEIGEVENWDTATITRPIGANMRIVDTALKRWFEVKGINLE